jgi:hypothetical protein
MLAAPSDDHAEAWGFSQIPYLAPQKNIMRTFLLCCLIFVGFHAFAQVQKAPDRKEGDGPYSQLIIRGVTLIIGDGSPPRGPMDIVVEGNRITGIHAVGYPGVPVEKESPQTQVRRPGTQRRRNVPPAGFH